MQEFASLFNSVNSTLENLQHASLCASDSRSEMFEKPIGLDKSDSRSEMSEIWEVRMPRSS